MRIDYNKLRSRLVFEKWTRTYNEANFFVAFDLFCKSLPDHTANCSYCINKKPRNNPLKHWTTGYLLMKTKRKIKMGIKANHNPNNLELIIKQI